MNDFSGAMGRFLQCAQTDMNKTFHITRDALVAGRWVPLEAWFDVEGERKPFGILPTGNFTHCFEYCLFLPAEQLGAAELAAFLDFALRAHDELVDPNEQHEFTIVSLVLLTAGPVDRAALRRLKRFSCERQYKRPQQGWSSVRVAAVDLEGRTIVSNRFGSALADRLKPTLARL